MAIDPRIIEVQRLADGQLANLLRDRGLLRRDFLFGGDLLYGTRAVAVNRRLGRNGRWRCGATRGIVHRAFQPPLSQANGWQRTAESPASRNQLEVSSRV